jgi:hypothetical protein
MASPMIPDYEVTMPLKATEVKYLTCPTDKKQIKKADGNGLFILIKSKLSIGRFWSLCRRAGKFYKTPRNEHPMRIQNMSALSV